MGYWEPKTNLRTRFEHSKHKVECTRGCLVSQRLAEQVINDVDTQESCNPGGQMSLATVHNYYFTFSVVSPRTDTVLRSILADNLI